MILPFPRQVVRHGVPLVQMDEDTYRITMPDPREAAAAESVIVLTFSREDLGPRGQWWRVTHDPELACEKLTADERDELLRNACWAQIDTVEGRRLEYTTRGKIETIRMVRARLQLGLKEAKDLIEAAWPELLSIDFGITNLYPSLRAALESRGNWLCGWAFQQARETRHFVINVRPALGAWETAIFETISSRPVVTFPGTFPSKRAALRAAIQRITYKPVEIRYTIGSLHSKPHRLPRDIMDEPLVLPRTPTLDRALEWAEAGGTLTEEGAAALSTALSLSHNFNFPLPIEYAKIRSALDRYAERGLNNAVDEIMSNITHGSTT